MAWLRVTIESTWKGKKWSDLAVSELDVHGVVKTRVRKPHRAWTEADFYGGWSFSDGTGYKFRRNGKADYEGPRGGVVEWYVDGDTLVVNRLEKLEIVSASEVGTGDHRMTRDKK